MRFGVLLLLLRQCVCVFVISTTVSVAGEECVVFGKDDDGFSLKTEREREFLFLITGRNTIKTRRRDERAHAQREVHFFSITTTTTTTTITTMRRGDERERERVLYALFLLSLSLSHRPRSARAPILMRAARDALLTTRSRYRVQE